MATFVSGKVYRSLPCPTCGGVYCDYDEAKRTHTGIRCDGGPKLWQQISPPVLTAAQREAAEKELAELRQKIAAEIAGKSVEQLLRKEFANHPDYIPPATEG